MTLFGGFLVWICHDYFTNWFWYDFNTPARDFPAAVIAKSVFWHSIFLMFMTIGLLIPFGGWIERLCNSIPEPSYDNLYYLIIAGLALIGFFPFFVWTYDPPHIALLKAMLGPWIGRVEWTVGRTGNFNYSWGGYVAQLIQVGQVGAILASFAAILK